jgi:hypothetical protein
MTDHRRLATVLLMCVTAFLALAPATASAGTYTQYLCFDPNTGRGLGVPPEMSWGTNGWWGASGTDCTGPLSSAKGLNLTDHNHGHLANSGEHGWIRDIAPSSVTLSGAHVWRATSWGTGWAGDWAGSQHGGGDPTAIFASPSSRRW